LETKEYLNVLEVQLKAFDLEESETERKIAALQSTTALTHIANFMVAIVLIARYVLNGAGIPLLACTEAVALIAADGLCAWFGESRRNKWAESYPDEWYGRMPSWYMATVKTGKAQTRLMGMTRILVAVVIMADLVVLLACVYLSMTSHGLFMYGVMPVAIAGAILLNAADEWAHDVEFYAVWQNVLAHETESTEKEC